MDLRSAAEAIRSHRRVAYVGVGLAFLLSILAFAKPVADVPPLEPREPVEYESTVRLFITQPGFPWGRSVLRVIEEQTVEGDPSRFAALALLYAQLANSAVIQREVVLDGERLPDIETSEVVATVVPTSEFSTNPLPLIDITALHTSADGSQQLARDTAIELRNYVVKGQTEAGTPESERIVLLQIDAADPGEAVGTPVLSLPVIVFTTIVLLTLGLIFTLSNLERTTRGALDDETERGGETGPMTPVVVEDDDDIRAREAAGVMRVRASQGHRPPRSEPVADRSESPDG